MKVTWTRAAVRDIVRHVAYLKQVNPIAARELAETLYSAGESLSAFPHRGRKGRASGTRDLVSVYPYVITYKVQTETVVIQRVWHGKLLA